MITNDSIQVVQLLESAMQEAIHKKGYCVLAMAGGRSVKAFIENMKSANLPWKNIHVFMVDERLVPITDPESNYKMLKDELLESFISAGKLPVKNVHPFDIENQTVEEYSATLEDFGGGFDVAILGVGEDGHIGALFPNYSINSDSEHYFTIDKSPKPPKDRMTCSRKMIASAGLCILLVFGEGKRQALENFSDTKLKVSDCPAKAALQSKKHILLTDLT